MNHTLTQRIETYEQATRWLYDRIDYERTRPDQGQRNPFRLDRTERLLTLIGSPQQRIPCVHLAGTKGKGSTAAMLESMLRAGGVRTGLFTSPHIHRVEERMRVSGLMPTPEEFTLLVDTLNTIFREHDVAHSDHVPTFFETTTLLAWMLFDQRQADLVVLETGLGGRLDCTNVCSPLVTLITSIGLDHTHILGNTIELIAAEKAGILKPGVPTIIGRLPAAAAAVVRRRAAELNCPLDALGDTFDVRRDDFGPSGLTRTEVFTVSSAMGDDSELRIPLRGQHQVDNAALAVMCVRRLNHQGVTQITPEQLRQGLAEVVWPVRFEIFDQQPLVVLDGAHNPDSVRSVVATLDEAFPEVRDRVLVFGVSADKDAASMLAILLPAFSSVVATRFLGNPRSVPPAELARQMTDSGFASRRTLTEETPEAAMSAARQLVAADGLICVTGSLFLAAEVRQLLLKSKTSELRPGVPFAASRMDRVRMTSPQSSH